MGNNDNPPKKSSNICLTAVVEFLISLPLYLKRMSSSNLVHAAIRLHFMTGCAHGVGFKDWEEDGLMSDSTPVVPQFPGLFLVAMPLMNCWHHWDQFNQGAITMSTSHPWFHCGGAIITFPRTFVMQISSKVEFEVEELTPQLLVDYSSAEGIATG